MLGALGKTVGSRARLADVVPIGGRAVGGAAARNSSADDGDSGYSRGSSRGSSDPQVDSDDDDALDHEHDESTEEGSEQEEFRSETHRFVCQLVKSDGFNRLTVGVIVFNTVSIGAETFRALKMTGSFAVIFGALDLTFVTYYTMELALKIYSYPRSFWVSKYNQFDVFVLATSYVQLAQDIFGATLLPLGNVTFLRVLRALRALRALRGISFIRSLQVLVAALRTTVSEVLNLVLLLALLMYIFGIMGYYFFGSAEYAEKGHSTADWDSLSAGCMSLFVFVTADGWTDLQWKLDEDGYTGSKLFTVGFLLVGHFIFINIFIGAETRRFCCAIFLLVQTITCRDTTKHNGGVSAGVVIRNIEQAAQEEASWQQQKRASSYLAKKRAAIAEQDRKLSQKMQQESSSSASSSGGSGDADVGSSEVRGGAGGGGAAGGERAAGRRGGGWSDGKDDGGPRSTPGQATDEKGKKTRPFRQFILKMINLPRQARYEHSENSKKRRVFL